MAKYSGKHKPTAGRKSTDLITHNSCTRSLISTILHYVCFGIMCASVFAPSLELLSLFVNTSHIDTHE